MILVKNIVIRKPTMSSKLARGNTSSSPVTSLKCSYRVSAAYGKMCRIATLTNSAPANVVPIDLKNLFLRNLFTLRGRVPTIKTIATKPNIKSTFKMIRRSFYSINLDMLNLLLSVEKYREIASLWLPTILIRCNYTRLDSYLLCEIKLRPPPPSSSTKKKMITPKTPSQNWWWYLKLSILLDSAKCC